MKINLIVLTKLFISLFFLFTITTIQAQFVINSGATVYVEGQTDLYADINLVNSGEITYDINAMGGLYIDAGLDNSAGILTLNDAVLHLGSNTSRADGNHDLLFNDNDVVKFVELGKTTGTYTVTGGLLNITNTFTSNAGTLEANDNIVLKSTSIQNTALVPESTTGNVNGIRVERFIPAQRGWRFMASPVTTDDFIFENWQQNGLNPGDTAYRPNVGTHITGGTTANGFDQSGSNNPSMYVFDFQNAQYNPIQNTNATKLLNSEGYFVLIRGDRSINLQINDTSEIETTLEQTGSLHIGTKTNTYDIATNNESFILAGNPYQAPVDMNAVIGASNTYFKNQIWVWVQTDQTTGQFVSIDDLSNPTPSVTGSNVTEDLQPGQAVFIQTKDGVTGTTSLTFNEIDKVDSSNLTETFSQDANSISDLDGFLRIGLYDVNATPFIDVAYDGFIVKFDSQYSNNIDDLDAIKLFNNEENLAISLNNNFLSVNKRKLPNNLDEIIDISIFNLNESQYVFSIELEGLNNLPNGIMLWDKYLDDFITLQDQALINFSIDSAIPESFAENRFALVFENSTLSTQDQLFSEVSLYPNPVFDNAINIQFSKQFNTADVKVEIFSINGKLVLSKTYTNATRNLKIENLNFSSGVYMLKINQGDFTNTFKIIKQ